VALELAEAATALPHDVSDELFARLREHYSDAEIVELSYIIALENFRSRFNRTLRVEAQGLYCVVPEHQPARD
jgi:alkylhydroperoxidase family enzyme